MKHKILQIICIALGIIFIVSGLGKIINTASFGNLIAQYGLGRLQILAPFIVIIEITVGISLVLCIKPQIMSLISFGLLLLFTTAFTYGHFKNGINNCGCFGIFENRQDNILIVYIRNIILMSMSLFVSFQYPKISKETSETKKMILLGILLPVIFVAGLTYRIPNFLYANKPHELINKNIRETTLYQYIHTLPNSSYLVFFYSYNCPHCWNSIENYKSFKTSNAVDSIVSFVIVNTDSSLNTNSRNLFIENFGNFGTQEIINDSIVQSLIRVVPTSFYIKNDTVKAVIESELPSPFTFNSYKKD